MSHFLSFQMIRRPNYTPPYLYHLFFFLNDTATTEIYPLPLHDALPISRAEAVQKMAGALEEFTVEGVHTTIPFHRRGMRNDVFKSGNYDTSFLDRHYQKDGTTEPDRKSTRLNSSHGYISYAVFCLKKKK